MAINTETLYRKLYDNLSSSGYNPTAENAKTGKEVVPEEADFLEFDFDKGDGTSPVTVSVEKANDRYSVTVYYTDDVAEEGTDEWYNVLKDLRYAARVSGIKGFVLRNRNHLKPDMQKREYMKNQEQLAEGYYPMGKKASYSDAVPAVKIILQHSRQIEEGEQRYRNISKIFVENQSGERFLIPTTKPGIARVFARHISEGGTPYDDRGQHIGSLVEEYAKMSGFVRATRGHQFNESAQKLVESGVAHYESLRETLSRMTGRRGYSAYFESWTPPLMEDDADTSNLNELFVQETLDPRIESVMPILSKLQKSISEMSEVSELAEWADSLLEAPGAETLAHNQSTEEKRLQALDLEEDESLTSNNPVGIPEEQFEDIDLEEGEFAGDFKTGPEGQWRNKGPKANKPAKVGDLVGASESVDTDEEAITESEGRPYVCVHAKKGQCNVTANSSYEAAQKAAKKWGLKGTAGIDAHVSDVKKDPSSLEESIQLAEGLADSLKGIVNKIKSMPGIQKFIGAAKAKQQELAQALQQSRNGKDLMANIQQVMGGQQAVAEGWGDKLGGAFMASAGGGLMAGGADLLMKAYLQMGKPDLTQMTGDQQGGMLFLTSLIVLGALALFAGGHQVKQGMDNDTQQMREGQDDLDAILRIIRK